MREYSNDAPGRVNLIGEHTDYQDGYVLPCAVPQRTSVTLRPRLDGRVHASTDTPGFPAVEFSLGQESRLDSWGDYIQGLTWALTAERHHIGGFDLHVRSDVPVGSGLASSAALEVATLRALRAAFDLALTDVALAVLARRAEVEFVGAPVGIMDQMASSIAKQREGLFLDTRTLSFERIPFPADLDIAVIDSGLTHRHAGGEYGVRRQQAEEAARHLGVATLRDVDVQSLADVETRLSPLLGKRARHIVTENARVLAARHALLVNDLTMFGQLLNASHESLRDDYNVSLPPIDALVALAVADSRTFGARMTGGGFGGAIVVAAEAGTAREIAVRVSDEYLRTYGRKATIWLPET